jgi:hypothetical protein
VSGDNFTPGPWVVIPRSESSGKSVGTVEAKPETMQTTNYWTVADVNGLRAEWESNLRLIAAAPELLEALRECVKWEGSRNPNGDDSLLPPEKQLQEWIAAAMRAIAKATGSTAC